MTDKENTEATTETLTGEENRKDTSCAGTGCNHLPLVVAFIALLLAAYAVISNQGNVSSSALNSRLQQMDAQLATINQRIDSMETDVASNRESLVKTQLKKLLLNIQEISSMAAAETRDQLAQVETLLKDITQPAAEKAAVPEATPAAEAAPADNNNTEAAVPDQRGNSGIPSVELQIPNGNDNADNATATEPAASEHAL